MHIVPLRARLFAPGLLCLLAACSSDGGTPDSGGSASSGITGSSTSAGHSSETGTSGGSASTSAGTGSTGSTGSSGVDSGDTASTGSSGSTGSASGTTASSSASNGGVTSGTATSAGDTGSTTGSSGNGTAGATTGGATSGASTGDNTASSGGARDGGAASSTGTTGATTGADAGPLKPALAFPEAQGFGKNATGGRSGTVYHVTNLADSGAGSFRDAVSSSNRIVVFDVGGYVQLATAVSVKSNITIAGQSAPGGGIGFRGGEISFANSSNIICRYVRIRPGSETASTEDDALSLFRASNVIIDHSSLEFAPWNNIDGVSDDWQNHPATDITFQDSLIADPTGQQFGAHTESVSSQWAWYRNIFANSHNRNPLAKVNTVFVNNVLYNDSAGYTTHTSTDFKHDILNNYFIFGPASTGTDNTWYQIDKNQSIYYAGNFKDSNLDGTLDGAATTPYWYQGTGTVLSSAWSAETTATAPLDAASAVRVTTSLAGPLPRDPIDALIIGQVLTLGKGTTGTGADTVGPDGALYTSQAQTGLANDGYGSIASGTKPTDTDDDGMPDDWESANGSNPSADDAMKKAADGYTLIEHYLNWLAEPHATSAAGAAVNVDLSAYATGFGAVSPKFAASGAQSGTVTLQADGHTASFQPAAGFHGVATFAFSVTGSDGSQYSGRVAVLSTP